MGEGTEQNPYTREDVLKKIEENGGKAEGPDLSRKWFEEGINLNEVNLGGVNLRNAHLKGVLLWGAKFTDDTSFEDVDWGKEYVLGEEKNEKFGYAAQTYRRLKQWHTNAGIYDIAGEFFFREMEARRKELKSHVKPWDKDRVALKISKLVFGYGERPWWVIRWAVLVIVISTLIYLIIGSVFEVWESSVFQNAIYFSAVSFIALGYGNWVNLSDSLASSIIKGLGVTESFIGVFSIALFLVTFTRKMTRL